MVSPQTAAWQREVAVQTSRLLGEFSRAHADTWSFKKQLKCAICPKEQLLRLVGNQPSPPSPGYCCRL